MPLSHDDLLSSDLAESDRLFSLERYSDLVTTNEPIFDALTALGASLFDAPLCLITLTNSHRKFFKSAYGITVRDLSQAEAFCNEIQPSDELQVILDAAKDSHFADKKDLLRDTGIRFYAGIALSSNDGANLGTFCVLDVAEQRDFSPKKREALINFAFLASRAIEGRLLAIQIARTEAAMVEASSRVRQILEATTDSVFLVDQDWNLTFLNEVARNRFAHGKDLIGSTIWTMLPSPRGEPSHGQYRRSARDRSTLAFEGVLEGEDAIFEVKVQPSGKSLAVFVRDITEQRATELALHKIEERYRIATGSVTEGIWDWDQVTGIAYFSERWQLIAGLPATPYTGSIEHWMERLHPEDMKAFRDDFSRLLAGVTSEFSHEYRIRHEDGTWRWILNHGTVICDENYKRVRMAGAISDNTAKKSTDPLSGLHNRMSLLEHIDRQIELQVRGGPTFAVLAVNLDAFKSINERFSHIVGDHVLLEVARRLNASLENASLSIAARTSADEFVILLHGITEVEDVRTYVNFLQAAVSSAIDIESQQISVTACIGVAMGDEGYLSSSKMLENAEMALHQAKREGAGRCVVFGTDLRNRTRKRIQLDSDLRHAIDANEFVLHYQPKVLLKTGEIIGLEALVRWNHPTYGIVSPADFIPLAEESGLILDIGRWTLVEAIRQLSEWRFSGLFKPDVTMSVNLSAKQFEDPNLLRHIVESLAQNGSSPGCLSLEITESALITNINHARETMNELRKIGVGLDLDDFGTGYSSLSYLHGLPFDSVKIDQSFIRQISDSEESRVIVRSIIQLGESLNLNVIAEGIENAEQAKRLSMLHCHYGQGHFYSRPLPAASMAAHVRQRAN